MSITKKILVAGMLVFAFAAGMEAKANETVAVRTVDGTVVHIPVVRDGRDGSLSYRAESGKTGRDINEDLYPIRESQSD